MKVIKISLIGVAFLGLSINVMAQNPSGTCGANLTWELDLADSTLTISGSGDMDNFTSPNYAPWYSSYRNAIKTVVIGDSVTSIGDWAFGGLYNLTSIIIGDNVTTIKDYAFQANWLLDSIFIPRSITSIGESVFDQCLGLTSIEVDNDNTRYSSIDGILYTKMQDTLIKYPIGKANYDTNYIIPNSVTDIGAGAFWDCGGLTSVAIGNSVTSIGWGAFGNCFWLVSVTVQWTEPLSILEGVFFNVPVQDIKLCVPQETADKYRSAEVWKDFQVDECDVGIVETDNYPSLRVYPNPTKGQLTIENGQLTIENVEIYNVVGQVVLSTEALRSLMTLKSGESTIDVSSLANGMYYLKIDNKVVKFVKE